MEDNKANDFSRTVLWKKSKAADAERDRRLSGKVSLVLGTVGASAVVIALLYFLFR